MKRPAPKPSNPKPTEAFRLRDGSFKGGHGLHPGVRWSDLTALAYAPLPKKPC